MIKMKRFTLILLIILLNSFLLAQDESVFSALARNKQHLPSQALLMPAGPVQTLSQSETDAQYYEIQITVDYENSRIYGLVRARFRVRSDSLRTLWLDLKSNMDVESISGAGTVFQHQNDLLQITLNQTYLRDDTLSVCIRYSGTPSAEGFGYFTFDEFPDHSSSVWSLSEPYGAKYWWPCKDTPADKADSADIFITVPGTQLAASNGLLLSVQSNSDGAKTFHWRERYPIATYLIALTAGSYAHFQDMYHFSDRDSMLLDYYVYPEYLSTAEEIFPQMQDYLDALSYYFGPYPFSREKYGMIQFGWGGGMEHQTLTSIGRVKAAWTFVYVHELAHQWFGDAVTCASWRDIWLNEGFASYAEALYAEWAGFQDFHPGMKAYHAYMLSQRYTEDKTILVADTSSVSNIFDKVVYHKGSWVLHMLRHVLGDTVFFDVLKSYWQNPQWQYGSVRTSDFISVCEQKSGRTLKTFFDQWLNRPLFPIYSFTWKPLSKEDSGYPIQLQIIQQQDEAVYEMPLDIYVQYVSGGDTTITVDNTERNQEIKVYLEHPAILLLLDPDQWVLRDIQNTTTNKTTAAIYFERIFPNPSTGQVFLVTQNTTDQRELQIYNILGQKIRRLLPKQVLGQSHLYRWDGKNESGQNVSAGVYYVRPIANSGFFNIPIPTQKIIVIK